MLLERLRVPVHEFETASGWSLKPQGACRGDVCVPLPADAVEDGVVDVLATATAPDLVLPTIDGEEFHLSSLRGTKVVLVGWAPY